MYARTRHPLCIAVLLACMSSPALAQSTPESTPQTLDRIQVTGTPAI